MEAHGGADSSRLATCQCVLHQSLQCFRCFIDFLSSLSSTCGSISYLDSPRLAADLNVILLRTFKTASAVAFYHDNARKHLTCGLSEKPYESSTYLRKWSPYLPSSRHKDRNQLAFCYNLKSTHSPFLQTALLFTVFLFLLAFLFATVGAENVPPSLPPLSVHQRLALNRLRRQVPMQPVFSSSDAALGISYLPGDAGVANSTGLHYNQPPVVWIPYLGVVVILVVFTVLIVTFWLHIRRSRYRAIQLVKSSPNSEWHEIQPGRWQASYGGHIYTVSQVKQTSVLGAIAAATAVAMTHGVRRVISASRQAPDLIEIDKLHGHSSAAMNEEFAEVDVTERSHLLASQKNSSSPTGHANLGYTISNGDQWAASTSSPTGVTSFNNIPVSDSVWMLTEEQLINSIRSSNKSNSIPTPTTITTITGDGLPNYLNISSTNNNDNINWEMSQPSSVPQRNYGSLSQSSGHTSSPATNEVAINLCMTDDRRCGLRTPSQHSQTPLEDGIALATLLRKSADAVSFDNDIQLNNSEVKRMAFSLGDSFTVGSNYSDGNPTAAIVGGDVGNDTVGELLSPRESRKPFLLDEMTLPEPEPWKPTEKTTALIRQNSIASTRPGPSSHISSNLLSTSSSNQGQSSALQANVVTTNALGQRRTTITSRGSIRGRGRGNANRSQLSAMIAYSNMSKRKTGFIIPRG